MAPSPARAEGRALRRSGPGRPGRRIAAAALGFAAVIASLGAFCAPAPASTLTTGISNSFANDPASMAHIRETGATMALIALRWNGVAPKQEPASWDPSNPADPNYDWSYFDTWLRNAVAAGLTPVVQIRTVPSWANRCTPNPEFESACNPDPNALAAFAHAAAERYSGNFEGLPKVRYWEAINEPNLTIWLEPQYQAGKLVSPQMYRGLLERFYSAVKAVDPSNLVLAPGLAPLAVKRKSPGPMVFTEALLCMKGGAHPKPLPGNCGGGVPFDIFDIHPYTTGGPTHSGGTSGISMGDLGKIQSLLAAADKAGRIKGAFKRTPLWITEMSWDSKPPDPGGLAMKTEMQWIPEALYQAWLHHVPVFMWYSIEDEVPPPGSNYTFTIQSGFYFYAKNPAEAKPKPMLAAYRFPFVALREGRGLRFWGRTPTGSGGKVKLQALEGGRWKQIGTARASKGGIFTGFLRSGYGAGEKGAVRAAWSGRQSPGFPMKRVADFPQPPFGCCS